jgi:hypothetical protein
MIFDTKGRIGVVASIVALLVSYAPAMNPSSVSLFRIPAILLYKDEGSSYMSCLL